MVSGVWRRVATHKVRRRLNSTRRSPVGNHAAAHGLVRISVVGRIPSHGHGPVLHVPLRNDAALSGSPSRVLVDLAVRSLSEGIGRRLLLRVLLWRRRLVHLRPRKVSQRLRSVWVRIHGRRRPAALVKSLCRGPLGVVVVLLRWRASGRVEPWGSPLLWRTVGIWSPRLLLLLHVLGRWDLPA